MLSPNYRLRSSILTSGGNVERACTWLFNCSVSDLDCSIWLFSSAFSCLSVLTPFAGLPLSQPAAIASRHPAVMMVIVLTCVHLSRLLLVLDDFGRFLEYSIDQS